MHRAKKRKQAGSHCFEWSKQPRTPGRGIGATTTIETSQYRKNHKMTRPS